MKIKELYYEDGLILEVESQKTQEITIQLIEKNEIQYQAMFSIHKGMQYLDLAVEKVGLHVYEIKVDGILYGKRTVILPYQNRRSQTEWIHLFQQDLKQLGG